MSVLLAAIIYFLAITLSLVSAHQDHESIGRSRGAQSNIQHCMSKLNSPGREIRNVQRRSELASHLRKRKGRHHGHSLSTAWSGGLMLIDRAWTYAPGNFSWVRQGFHSQHSGIHHLCKQWILCSVISSYGRKPVRGWGVHSPSRNGRTIRCPLNHTFWDTGLEYLWASGGCFRRGLEYVIQIPNLRVLAFSYA